MVITSISYHKKNKFLFLVEAFNIQQILIIEVLQNRLKIPDLVENATSIETT